MKIAWLCNSSLGVSETFLGNNLNLLNQLGTVRAFSGNPITADQGSHPDVQHLEFDYIPQRFDHILRQKLTGKNIRALSKRKKCFDALHKTLKKFNPDVIWVEYGTTAHVASDLLRALNRPYFIAVHGFDITREFRDPWYETEFVRIANKSAAVICASFHTQNLCRVSGVLPEKTAVIRLPLDSKKLRRTISLPVNQPMRFIHLGRLVAKKGPMHTLMAFHSVLKSNINATLTFIGEGPLRTNLEAYIEHHQLNQQVHLLGTLSQNEAIKEVQQHHIFCQHSVTDVEGDQEGFALSPAEAALLEMPVVATWHNGIPEHVIQNKTGILVREWDLEGMADAMIKLAKNEELRQTMGRKGRQNIIEMCDPADRLKKLRTLLSSAVK